MPAQYAKDFSKIAFRIQDVLAMPSPIAEWHKEMKADVKQQVRREMLQLEAKIEARLLEILCDRGRVEPGTVMARMPNWPGGMTEWLWPEAR